MGLLLPGGRRQRPCVPRGAAGGAGRADGDHGGPAALLRDADALVGGAAEEALAAAATVADEVNPFHQLMKPSTNISRQFSF